MTIAALLPSGTPAAGRRRFLSMLAGSLLGAATLVLPAAAAQAQQTPQAVVETFYQGLLQVMKEGKTLGFQGRFDRIRPLFEQAFNAPLMTRIVVGPPWTSAPPDQQAAAIEAFIRYSVANYAANFKDYGGERFEVSGAKPIQAGTLVESQIVAPGEAPVTINYLLRPVGSGWKIADVYLDGTISQLATQRSDFRQAVASGGLPGLVAQLDAKVQALATNQ